MPILQCQGLTKYYGGVLALDHADIAIEPVFADIIAR